MESHKHYLYLVEHANNTPSEAARATQRPRGQASIKSAMMLQPAQAAVPAPAAPALPRPPSDPDPMWRLLKVSQKFLTTQLLEAMEPQLTLIKERWRHHWRGR